jgi:hypothetical protein
MRKELIVLEDQAHSPSMSRPVGHVFSVDEDTTAVGP